MNQGQLDLGFVPLLDASPLILAQCLGFAAEEGLGLTLTAAPSWSALRDRLASGQIIAAQMLAPLPVASALGLGGNAARFEALMVLNLNGDMIGVSAPLAARMREQGYSFDFKDANAAGLAILAAVQGGLRIGVPFAFSTHLELIRYWLDGLNQPLPPGLEICTVPPPRMAQALAAGEIDAFCVGEPHGSTAVDQGVGVLILPGSAIWASAPEKVLATRTGWAEAEPDLAGRLIRAVWRAGRWLESPQNAGVAAELLAAPDRLNCPAELIERALTGRMVTFANGREVQTPRPITFHDGAANFPWRSQAAWFGARLALRHGLPTGPAIAAARAVFRSDLYRQHLAQTGAAMPSASDKLEGFLAEPTAVPSAQGRLILPPDRFFDARVFDPTAPLR